ncbi:unnamed protein product [Ectocarpus sp. CCAP 1310/34]|nr:unnamed protein product [Ectocarpus sp. CCAP 1310/34]
MGKAKGRAKKKKFGNRGPDGRAVPKKPKPAQQNDNSSPGSGDAPVDGADLMDVDEEGTAAANEDANDEEWCDEDSSGANGSSGGGQSILRFAHRSVASAAARAARNAAKKISPPALSRSQKFRNRKRLLGQETKDMARFMGAFLRRAQQEKQQQSEQEEVESSSVGNEVRPVEESAVNLEIAPPTGPSNDGSVCGHVETSSSCGSVGDMPITTGHGLLIEEWCSGQEMKDAEEAMDDICDTSSDGFLDGLDFSSSSSRSSSRSGGGGGGGGGSSGAERGVPPCPLGKEAVDVGQETGANDEVGDKMRTTGVPVVADLLPPGPSRRSIRDGRFGGRFAAPTRRYDNTAGNNKGGTGRGNKVLAPEEVHDRSGVTAMQLQTNKSRRAVRRERVAQEGKIWTPAALARARDRTRKHWSRRKAELMETYRNAYDVLQKAEETNNYGSVVEDSTTMLDEAHLVRTTRVIRTVKHFLFLE